MIANRKNIVFKLLLFSSRRLITAFKSVAYFLVFTLSLPAMAMDQSPSSTIFSDQQNKNIADMDIDELVNLRVSPFDVATSLDRGYKASNSVTASRFDAPINELPFAIQAFTDTFIKDQKPDNIFDIARYSPGVTYRSNDFNEGNANLAIRGFTVSATKGNTQILRDGINGPSIFDFTNVDRVEVVKGPSSFLYGQIAPGGIVNIITKNPQSSFAATSDLSYGSYEQYRLDADVTGPISKTLFFRINASYDEDIHYWEPYDAHSWDFAPSLLWQPSERLSVSLKFENFSKVETPQVMQIPGYGPQTGIVPGPTDPNLSGTVVDGLPDNWNGLSYSDYRNSDTNSLITWADININTNWDLRVGYSHQFYEIDALATGNFGMANNSTLLQGRRVRGQTYTNEGDIFETHAVGKYNFETTSLRLLLGAQYVDRTFDDWAAQAPNDPVLGSNPTASPFPLWDLSDPSTWDRYTSVPYSMLTENAVDASTSYTDKSVYAGSTFGFLNDRLLLLAGLRLTSTENHYNDHLTTQTSPVFNESKTTPQLGILYQLNPEFSVFASYAESFLPGSQLLRDPEGTMTAAKPTQGEGYDIGIKANLFHGILSGTLSFFDIRNYNIVNDLAHTDDLGSVVIYNVQSGEQRSQGIELDITATLNDNYQLYFSYSYMDARITEFSGNDNAILAQDTSTLDAAGLENYRNVKRFHDAPLQMSAPQLANLWMRYDFTKAPYVGLYLAGGFNYVYDQTLQSDSPESSHQTYTLVNAKIGYQWKQQDYRLHLDLMGKNLNDEHYRPSQSTRSRPREYLLTLSVNF